MRNLVVSENLRLKSKDTIRKKETMAAPKYKTAYRITNQGLLPNHSLEYRQLLRSSFVPEHAAMS